MIFRFGRSRTTPSLLDGLLRLLLTLVLLAFVLGLMFVAGWLALLIVIGLVIWRAVRRLFGQSPAVSRPSAAVDGGDDGLRRDTGPGDSRERRRPVVIEGSYVREPDDKPPSNSA